MPKYIKIPFPSRKLAKNLFEPLDSCQNAVGFDLVTTTNSLKPFPMAITAVSIPADAAWTTVTPKNSLLASNGKYYVVGKVTISSAENLGLWTTTALSASPTWTLAHNVAGVSSSAIAEYKDGIFVSDDLNLVRWGDISGSPSASNVSTGLTAGLDLLLSHVGLGLLFFVHNSGKTVGKYDNSTVTLSALTIQTGERIVSIKEYGRYVALGIRTVDSASGFGNGKSRIVLWDGSDTAILDQSPINDAGLSSIQVIGSQIVAICTPIPSVVRATKLKIYQGSPGGEMKLADWKEWHDTYGPTGLNDNAVCVADGKVWFGPSFVDGTTDGGIFVYDPDQRNLYRALVPAAGTTDDTFTSIKMFGTSSLITYTPNPTIGTGIMNAIGISSSAQTGTLESNFFPVNGGLLGKINRIFINHAPLPTSSGFTVSVKQIGNYPFGTSVPTEESYQDLAVPGGSGSSTGKTQATENATFTEISSPLFTKCRYAQIKIAVDDTTSVANGEIEIATPIIVEVE